jgi:hypothetical protein
MTACTVITIAMIMLLRDFGPFEIIFMTMCICTIRNFITCTHSQISLGRSSQGGRGMWHAWERRENCTRFWWESPKERDHSEDQGVGGIRMDLKRLAWGGGLNSTSSGHGPVAGCCECGDEPWGSCATELVSYVYLLLYISPSFLFFEWSFSTGFNLRCRDSHESLQVLSENSQPDVH